MSSQTETEFVDISEKAQNDLSENIFLTCSRHELRRKHLNNLLKMVCADTDHGLGILINYPNSLARLMHNYQKTVYCSYPNT